MKDSEEIPAQEKECCQKNWKNRCRNMHQNGGPGTFYGLGFVGAVVYFLQQAHTFQQGVIGVLKAIVWPALLIYRVLGFFKF